MTRKHTLSRETPAAPLPTLDAATLPLRDRCRFGGASFVFGLPASTRALLDSHLRTRGTRGKICCSFWCGVSCEKRHDEPFLHRHQLPDWPVFIFDLTGKGSSGARFIFIFHSSHTHTASQYVREHLSLVLYMVYSHVLRPIPRWR